MERGLESASNKNHNSRILGEVRYYISSLKVAPVSNKSTHKKRMRAMMDQKLREQLLSLA
jgi:hypothetical protein